MPDRLRLGSFFPRPGRATECNIGRGHAVLERAGGEVAVRANLKS